MIPPGAATDVLIWAYAQLEKPMSKELEGALYQAVAYLLQARAYQMEREKQWDAQGEALGYLDMLREAYLKPPAGQDAWPDPFAEE